MKIEATNIAQYDSLAVLEQQAVLERIQGMDDELSGVLRGLNVKGNGAGTLRASSIPYYMRCPHLGYLDLVCAPLQEHIPAKLRWIFDVGTAVHELVQEKYFPLLRDRGPEEWTVFENELAVWCEELLMSGHSDSMWVVEDHTRTIKFGVEIKTINDNGFTQVKRSNKPKVEHRQQGLFYQWMLDLPVMLYYYVNKNTQARLSIAHPFDSNYWESEVKPVLVSIVEAARAGESPGKKTGYHCRECKYNPLSCKPGKHTRKL